VPRDTTLHAVADLHAGLVCIFDVRICCSVTLNLHNESARRICTSNLHIKSASLFHCTSNLHSIAADSSLHIEFAHQTRKWNRPLRGGVRFNWPSIFRETWCFNICGRLQWRVITESQNATSASRCRLRPPVGDKCARQQLIIQWNTCGGEQLVWLKCQSRHWKDHDAGVLLKQFF
jgi:hypothetical protein